MVLSFQVSFSVETTLFCIVSFFYLPEKRRLSRALMREEKLAEGIFFWLGFQPQETKRRKGLCP